MLLRCVPSTDDDTEHLPSDARYCCTTFPTVLCPAAISSNNNMIQGSKSYSASGSFLTRPLRLQRIIPSYRDGFDLDVGRDQSFPLNPERMPTLAALGEIKWYLIEAQARIAPSHGNGTFRLGPAMVQNLFQIGVL
jgi:hypothetical protein